MSLILSIDSLINSLLAVQSNLYSLQSIPVVSISLFSVEETITWLEDVLIYCKPFPGGVAIFDIAFGNVCALNSPRNIIWFRKAGRINGYGVNWYNCFSKIKKN